MAKKLNERKLETKITKNLIARLETAVKTFNARMNEIDSSGRRGHADLIHLNTALAQAIATISNRADDFSQVYLDAKKDAITSTSTL